MIITPGSHKLALAYIYKDQNPDFQDDLKELQPFFDQIIILNLISKETLVSSAKNIKIINVDKETYQDLLQELFTSRFNADYLVLLEDTEKLVISEDKIRFTIKKLEKEPWLSLAIKPHKYSIFRFEEEPFLLGEKRFFNIKNMAKYDPQKLNIFSFTQTPLLNEQMLSIEKKDYDAEFEYNKALSIENPGWQNFMAGIAFFYKESPKAITFFQNTLEHSENQEAKKLALAFLFKIHYQRLEIKEAESLSNKYQVLGKDNILFCLYQVPFYLDQKKYKQAIRNIHQVLKSENMLPFIYNYSDVSWKAHYYLGKAFFELKRYYYATHFLTIANNKLEKLCGRFSPDTIFLLAKVKFLAEDYETAYQYFVEFFKEEHTPLQLLRDARYAFLNLLLFIPFRQEYLDILRKPVFDNADSLLRLADTFYLSDEYEDALKLYLLIVERFGSNEKLLFKLAFICSKLKIFEQAAYYYQKYLELKPDDHIALNNLAFIYLNKEDLEKAEATYLKILELNNFSFDANMYLAMINISRENAEKASEYLERAKTLNPVSPHIIKLYQIYKQEFGET